MAAKANAVRAIAVGARERTGEVNKVGRSTRDQTGELKWSDFKGSRISSEDVALIKELKSRGSDDDSHFQTFMVLTHRTQLPAHHLPGIADYVVDCVTPFNLKQNQPVVQGETFLQVRWFASRFDRAALVPIRFQHPSEYRRPRGGRNRPIIKVTE